MQDHTNRAPLDASPHARVFHTPERCPECGHTVEDQQATVSAFGHWHLIGPSVMVVLVVLALTFVIVRNGITSTNRSPTEPRALQILHDPAFTLADVQRIAQGLDPDAAIILLSHIRTQFNRWPSQIPIDRLLVAGFAEAEPDREVHTTFGWPAAWAASMHRRLYENSATGENPIHLGDSVEHRWHFEPTMLSLTRSSFASNTMRGWISISLPAIALSVLVILIAVTSARWATLGWNRWRRPAAPRSARRWAAATGALALAAVLVAAAFTRETRSDLIVQPLTLSHSPDSVAARTSVNAAAMRQLPNSPVSGSVLAQAILAATGRTHNDGYLAVNVIPDPQPSQATQQTYCPPFILVVLCHAHWARQGTDGTTTTAALPAGVWTVVEGGRLVINRSAGDIAKPHSMLIIDLRILSIVLLGLIMLWALMRWIVRAADRRLLHRRQQRNQCIACGHALGPG